MKDRPFCSQRVVSRGGAVSYRGAKCTKNTIGADKGRSHKTSRSLIRGSLVAGSTVINLYSVKDDDCETVRFKI